MIIVPGEQGTDEWHALRRGIPTASNFSRIVTPSCTKSTQADTYMAELIAERVTGKNYSEWGGNDDTERGHLFEPDARAFYEFDNDVEVDQVTFVYRDDSKQVGCSPDGLVFDHAPADNAVVNGCEIKCPREVIHVAYYAANVVPKQYIPQIQGSMWICDVDRWDFISYHQDYPPLYILVDRDEKFSKMFDKVIPEFCERLQERLNEPRIAALLEAA